MRHVTARHTDFAPRGTAAGCGALLECLRRSDGGVDEAGLAAVAKVELSKCLDRQGGGSHDGSGDEAFAVYLAVMASQGVFGERLQLQAARCTSTAVCSRPALCLSLSVSLPFAEPRWLAQ